MTATPELSVVVCTYNRARLLAGVLEALRGQTLDPLRYEIVVIDNNSTDDTRRVVETFPHVRYAFEATQGIAHARNRGWREARGRYVGYVDDDCRPPAQWLATATRLIERVAPNVVGGPYLPLYDAPVPRWLKDSHVSFVPGHDAGFLKPEQYTALIGGNVFVRREVFEAVEGFDPRLGHVGTTIAYGEETAFFRNVSDRFPGSLYYDPALYVHHLVRTERLTLSYNVRAAFAAGRSFVRRQQPPPDGWAPLVGQAALTLLRLAADVPVRLLLRDRAKYPYPMTYIVEHTLHYVHRLGFLYEQGHVRASGQLRRSR